MINPIKQIYDFNHKAGLTERGYDDFLENSFQIEEALEGFDLTDLDMHLHGDGSQVPLTAKDMSRSILLHCKGTLSDVDRLDKACDAVIFAVGSMTKLGLNPQQITKALNTVMQCNLAKLDMHKDEFGKITKPANFVGPEAKLQAILDERS